MKQTPTELQLDAAVRALLEATPFLKNDDRIPVWKDMYDRAAAMLNGEDLAKMLDRSATRKEA